MCLDRVVGTKLELQRTQVMAARAALRVYAGTLQKKEDELEDLLGDTHSGGLDELQEQAKVVAKLLRVLSPQGEMPLEEATDDAFANDAKGKPAKGAKTAKPPKAAKPPKEKAAPKTKAPKKPKPPKPSKETGLAIVPSDRIDADDEEAPYREDAPPPLRLMPSTAETEPVEADYEIIEEEFIDDLPAHASAVPETFVHPLDDDDDGMADAEQPPLNDADDEPDDAPYAMPEPHVDLNGTEPDALARLIEQTEPHAAP
jgi:hypothetical protein